ncbi:MAG: CopG family transcriptional regulator [Nitrososphaerales archaeon]
MSNTGGRTLTGEVTQISIPKTLAERIRVRIGNTAFKSVDEYAAYVLDQVLNELESESNPSADNPFSKEDQENVEQRLRDLGYL